MECHPRWLWGAHAEMQVGECLTALACLSHFLGMLLLGQCHPCVGWHRAVQFKVNFRL